MGRGRRLLDVGCGEGQLLDLVHDRFEECVGTDVSKVALERATAQLGGRAALAVHDLDQPLPFDDSSFDVIACIAVAEHVFDVYGLVEEIARVVEPGGRVVLEVPNVAYLRNRIRLVTGRLPVTSVHTGRDLGWDGGHLHYFTREALIHELLEPAGLTVSLVTGSGFLASLRKWRPQLLCGDLMIVANRPHRR